MKSYNKVDKPYITLVLIGLNVLVFFLSFFYFSPEAMISLFSFSAQKFFSGSYEVILTSGFLHSGLPHLAMNMLFLLLFGRVVEEEYGRDLMLSIYLLGIILGNLALIIFFPESRAIGASGGVFALIGAATILEPMRPIVKYTPFPIALLGVVYAVPAIGNAFNLSEGIAHISHVAGLLGGSIVAYKKDKERAKKGILAVIAFTALLLGIGAF